MNVKNMYKKTTTLCTLLHKDENTVSNYWKEMKKKEIDEINKIYRWRKLRSIKIKKKIKNVCFIHLFLNTILYK